MLNYANQTNGIVAEGGSAPVVQVVKNVVEKDAILLDNINTLWYHKDVSKYLLEKKVHLVTSKTVFESVYSSFLIRKGCPWEDDLNLHML